MPIEQFCVCVHLFNCYFIVPEEMRLLQTQQNKENELRERNKVASTLVDNTPILSILGYIVSYTLQSLTDIYTHTHLRSTDEEQK